ncbi:hypothetical protein PR048_031387 [Dryococelus australis]|uniref:Transposase n=1 Tax=Dryococelus australis TaxID=614101 RepID=A0ABQ9G550_9NEOP|nr:hypothetical protein PR048_031387 [Dryococelus australis]
MHVHCRKEEDVNARHGQNNGSKERIVIHTSTCLRSYPGYWTNYLMITPFVKKKKHDTGMRKAITPNERLMATLRYLANWENT